MGRWSHTGHIGSPSELRVPHTVQNILKFDRVGNVRGTMREWRGNSTEPKSRVKEGTYRTDGNSFDIVWPRVWSAVYRVEEDMLTLLDSSGSDITYRRVPDDS